MSDENWHEQRVADSIKEKLIWTQPRISYSASGMNSRVRCDSSGARWRVTDDDLTRLSGKTEELAGVLQQRYGYSKKRN